MTQKLVEFYTFKPCKAYPRGALRIAVIDDEARQEIREIHENGQGINAQFHQIIEWQSCNGWTSISDIYYEQLGAMTGATILSEDFETDNQGIRVLRAGLSYYNPRYAIEDEVKTLLEEGEIIFYVHDFTLPDFPVGTLVITPDDPFLPREVYEVVKIDKAAAIEANGEEGWLQPYYLKSKHGIFDGWYSRWELVEAVEWLLKLLKEPSQEGRWTSTPQLQSITSLNRDDLDALLGGREDVISCFLPNPSTDLFIQQTVGPVKHWAPKDTPLPEGTVNV